MARLTRLLMGALCILSPLFSGASPLPGSLPTTIDFSASAARLSVSNTSLERTTIALNSPDIVTTNEVEGYEVFQAFRIAGEPTVPNEGNPTVPQVSRFYRIPNLGGVDLVVEQAEYNLIENVNPLPYHESRSEGDVARNSEVYSTDAWYPPQVAVVSEPMLLRDFRVVTVTLYPVQVNPVTHQARVYRTLEVSLAANGLPSVNEMTHPRRPSRAWVPVYRALIANLDDSALDDVTAVPGSYLIICTQDAVVRPYADTLGVWKKRSGYAVHLEARASWTANAMRTFIQDAYATWDPPLEYVTLMGGPTAPWGVPTGPSSDYDHFFALGNTGDDLEDIAVGRLWAISDNQLATIQAKLRSYECNPYMADTLWFKKAFLYADVGYNQVGNQRLMEWAARQLGHFTGIDRDTVAWSNNGVNAALVRSQFASGIGLFLWEGSWLFQMDDGLPYELQSGWRLPITATLYEATGNFDQGDCVAGNFLVAGTPTAPRAGICGIGSATSGSHWAPVSTVMAGFVFSMANLGLENLGVCLSAAKLWLSLTWGANSQIATFHTRIINLLGEPSLSIWTDTPVIMTAQHPDTVAVGARQIQLVVQDSTTGTPITDALVVLWKGEETYSMGRTDDSGHVSLPVNIVSSGDLLLTVTKRNHKPYLATLPCATVDQMVVMRSYSLDDDSLAGTVGNGDGQLNPGETIDVPVRLWNAGTTQTATTISAVLTSANPNVTIIGGNASYPDLAPGDSALGSAPFRIHVSMGMRHDESVALTVTVTASGVVTSSEFDLVCRAPRLEYVSSQAIPPLQPGVESSLAVTLRNTGAVGLPAAAAVLRALDRILNVSDPSGSYDSIAVGQQVANATDPFLVAVEPSAYHGSRVTMMLVSRAVNDYVDTVCFTLSIGEAQSGDATGPDAYGYYAYDNTDTLCNLHPTYDYVGIESLGNNLNLHDPGEQINVDTVYSRVRPLPFVFRFYEHVADSITICSNGWCAFGNQAWTDAFRNYPIPGILAPDWMIAP
jgi:hypothetical protein